MKDFYTTDVQSDRHVFESELKMQKVYYVIRNFNYLGFLAWAKGSLIRIGHLNAQ